MAETVGIRYRRLFQIRLLHHYWLDEGNTLFDLIPAQKKREERLLGYDVRRFLALEPTAATAELLQGAGCVFKSLASGCIVGAPETAAIPDEAAFEFAITVSDPAFYTYTALTMRPQPVHEIYHEPEQRLYRYKENVPLLSNLTGAARGTGPAKSLFLSKEFPALAADDQAEALFVSGAALMQLTGDQPGAGSRQLAPQAGQVPVFLNQGDVPAIVPPPGLAGAPEKGILLEGIPDRLFALVRLVPRRPGDPDFDLVDGEGHPKVSGPLFDLRFKSRSTTWQYFNKSTGALVSAETEPRPLTCFGNAGTKQKPSVDLVKAVQSGGRVTDLVSEIFI